jgi:hypothetical protein
MAASPSSSAFRAAGLLPAASSQLARRAQLLLRWGSAASRPKGGGGLVPVVLLLQGQGQQLTVVEVLVQQQGPQALLGAAQVLLRQVQPHQGAQPGRLVGVAAVGLQEEAPGQAAAAQAHVEPAEAAAQVKVGGGLVQALAQQHGGLGLLAGGLEQVGPFAPQQVGGRVHALGALRSIRALFRSRRPRPAGQGVAGAELGVDALARPHPVIFESTRTVVLAPSGAANCTLAARRRGGEPSGDEEGKGFMGGGPASRQRVGSSRRLSVARGAPPWS